MTVKVNAQTNLPTSVMLRDGEHPTLLSYHAVVTTTPTDIVTATPTEVQPNAAARAAMDHTTPKVLSNSEKIFFFDYHFQLHQSREEALTVPTRTIDLPTN